MEPISRIYQYERGNQHQSNPAAKFQSASIIVRKEPEEPPNIYSTSKCRNIAVGDYLTRMTDEVEKPLLLQITYAMKRVHDSGNTLRQDAFSVVNFRFSENWKELVWIVKSSDIEEATDDEKKKNIGWLAEVFKSIFNQANALNATSNHLLSEMRRGRSSAYSVLRHPYFWTYLKKIEFLCSVNGICSLVEGPGASVVTLDNKLSGWKKNLKDKCPHTGNPDLDAVEKLLIYSEKKQSSQFKDNGIDLLRFFRDCARHYWDEEAVNRRARALFNTEYRGFWKFFEERFPELLVAAFDWARTNKKAPDMIDLYLTEPSPTHEIFAMPEDAENV